MFSIFRIPGCCVATLLVGFWVFPVLIPGASGLLAQQQADSGPSVQLKTDMIREVAIKTGRAKAQGCTRCHGRNGLANLAKQSGWDDPISGFIVRELVSFRSGHRSHGIMNAVAAPLSDEDILQISLWFESLSER